jgi:hypothetical protein
MIKMRLFATLLAVLALILPVFAQDPALKELAQPDFKLRSDYEPGKPYSVRLEYTDKDGDRIKSAKFINDTPTNVSFDFKSMEGSVENGATLIWQINGFEKGAHSGYFEVVNATGKKTRYPEDITKFYTFSVSSVSDKWLKAGIGIVVCLLAIPFLFYLVARSVNKQGNPSSAARLGIILGVLAATAVFLVTFFGTYDWMVLGLVGLFALTLIIIALTKR